MKPNTINSMVITFVEENAFTTYFLNLHNTHIEYYEGNKAKVTIENQDSKLFPEKANVIISYSDDPSMMHAGDWTNMGCTRVLIVIDHGTKSFHDKHTIYEGAVTEKHVNMPERYPPNQDPEAELRI